MKQQQHRTHKMIEVNRRKKKVMVMQIFLPSEYMNVYRKYNTL